MVKGLIITYKPKDANARTLLNHTLYGRLVYKNTRGKKTAYYVGGILDNTYYSRIISSKVFILDEDIERYKELLEMFGQIDVQLAERDLHLSTAREYWENIAKERDYKFYICRPKK